MEKHFGLETFLSVERDRVKRQSDVLVITAHWALVSRSLLCVGLGETFTANLTRSERLPDNWNQEGTVYTIRYQDIQGKSFLLKVVAADDMLIFSLLSMETQKTGDLTLTSGEHVTTSFTLVGEHVDNVVSQIQEQLIKPVLGNVKGKEEVKGDSKNNQREKTPNMEDPSRANPLLIDRGRSGRVDPSMPGFGGMGAPPLGGSDLDPLGGMMGGGMVMDPTRGGRSMDPRFDPVGPGMGGGIGPMGGGFGGPGMGGGLGMGGMRGGRGGGRNFGDAMRPPGWDNNMYM